MASTISSIPVIENFTNKKTFTDLIKDSSSGRTIINMNDTKVGLSDGKKVGLSSSVKGAIDSFDKTINVSKWSVPTTLALNSFKDMGKDIDKSLESSFLLQSFHIKGTEVLCAVFCFLISSLSCNARNELHTALANINKATKAVNDTVKASNEIISAVGGITATADRVNSSVTDLFSGQGSVKQTIQAGTRATAVSLAAPVAILKNVKIISNALKLATNFKLTLPDIDASSLWDLSQNVLFMLQSSAVQAADEALSKLVRPIEDMVKNINPSLCFGTIATRMQNTILSVIKSFKSKILSELSNLFISNSDFNLKFKDFNLRSAFALELLAFSVALKHISANFFDIAMACGITPCVPKKSELDDYNIKDIGTLDESILYNTSGRFPSVFKSKAPVFADNLDELASKLAPSLNINNDIFVTPKEIIGVYNLGDAPKKIVDMINNGVLNNILNDNYEIYKTPDSVKILYRYKKNCGE